MSGGSQDLTGVMASIPASRRADEDHREKPTAMLVSQSSFKARSGPLQYSVGSGGAIPMQAVATNPGSMDALPSRETALQNTKLALERVLETYGPGKRRDYKRLVPFVSNKNIQTNANGQW